MADNNSNPQGERGEEKREPAEYIVDLPGIHELTFYVATHESYGELFRTARRSLTTATTPAAAVGNIVFRTLKEGTDKKLIDQQTGKRIMAAIKERQGSYAGYAFEVPEVFAEDEKPLEAHERTAGLDGFLCEQVKANRPGLTGDQAMRFTRQLVDFYQREKAKQAPQTSTQ